MERENKKRGREEAKEENKYSEKNAKKKDVIGFEDYDIFKLSDSLRPSGVFEFPWLKENLISEIDDWKFDDDFSLSLLDTSSATGIDFSSGELYQTPTLMELPLNEKFEEESWPSKGEDIDGVDCIWSSVLNQPLSIGFNSKVSNV